MTRGWHPKEILERAARAIGPLRESVMFVGGAVTWLHITDSATLQPRSTLDVDVVVEVASLSDYNAIGDRLRELGFEVDMREGAPVCRWRHDEITLDLLPTDGALLGFSNRFYRAAFSRADEHPIEGVGTIRVARATDFLAMKLEAFADRGHGDYLSSKDLEDVVAIIDGREEVVDELSACDSAIREYVAGEFTRLLADGEFEDALAAHLPGDAGSQARASIVYLRMATIAQLATSGPPRK